jgi:hypothetical protein
VTLAEWRALSVHPAWASFTTQPWDACRGGPLCRHYRNWLVRKALLDRWRRRCLVPAYMACGWALWDMLQVIPEPSGWLWQACSWSAMRMTACLGSSHGTALRTQVPKSHHQQLLHTAGQHTSAVWLLTAHLDSCSSGRASCGAARLQPAQPWFWSRQPCLSSGAAPSEAMQRPSVDSAASSL